MTIINYADTFILPKTLQSSSPSQGPQLQKQTTGEMYVTLLPQPDSIIEENRPLDVVVVTALLEEPV